MIQNGLKHILNISLLWNLTILLLPSELLWNLTILLLPSYLFFCFLVIPI